MAFKLFFNFTEQPSIVLKNKQTAIWLVTLM